MPDKRPKYDQHNPSQNSLQRWDNEGGATKRSRAKQPREVSQADKLVGVIATGQVENRPLTPEGQGKDLAVVRRGQLGGAKGGRSRAAALPEQQCKEIAEKPAKTRWKTASRSE
jgi:hypothetical protein